MAARPGYLGDSLAHLAPDRPRDSAEAYHSIAFAGWGGRILRRIGVPDHFELDAKPAAAQLLHIKGLEDPPGIVGMCIHHRVRHRSTRRIDSTRLRQRTDEVRGARRVRVEQRADECAVLSRHRRHPEKHSMVRSMERLVVDAGVRDGLLHRRRAARDFESTKAPVDHPHRICVNPHRYSSFRLPGFRNVHHSPDDCPIRSHVRGRGVDLSIPGQDPRQMVAGRPVAGTAIAIRATAQLPRSGSNPLGISGDCLRRAIETPEPAQ
ncbi:Uncharacterised protein [Mycobacteroides abscessus subsp. abscessus]|nr:Uncharacterised protein [Mycobacteroides abscessus subsp. abscessus]